MGGWLGRWVGIGWVGENKIKQKHLKHTTHTSADLVDYLMKRTLAAKRPSTNMDDAHEWIRYLDSNTTEHCELIISQEVWFTYVLTENVFASHACCIVRNCCDSDTTYFVSQRALVFVKLEWKNNFLTNNRTPLTSSSIVLAGLVASPHGVHVTFWHG